jgi:hypothetical protein
VPVVSDPHAFLTVVFLMLSTLLARQHWQPLQILVLLMTLLKVIQTMSQATMARIALQQSVLLSILYVYISHMVLLLTTNHRFEKVISRNNDSLNMYKNIFLKAISYFEMC